MVWHEGDVIRKLRELANWTLQDLSVATGVHPNVLNRIEKGRTTEPKNSTLDRIGAAFGLTAIDIRQAVPMSHPLQVRLRSSTQRKVEREAQRRTA